MKTKLAEADFGILDDSYCALWQREYFLFAQSVKKAQTVKTQFGGLGYCIFGQNQK